MPRLSIRKQASPAIFRGGLAIVSTALVSGYFCLYIGGSRLIEALSRHPHEWGTVALMVLQVAMSWPTYVMIMTAGKLRQDPYL